MKLHISTGNRSKHSSVGCECQVSYSCGVQEFFSSVSFQIWYVKFHNNVHFFPNLHEFEKSEVCGEKESLSCETGTLVVAWACELLISSKPETQSDLVGPAEISSKLSSAPSSAQLQAEISTKLSCKRWFELNWAYRYKSDLVGTLWAELRKRKTWTIKAGLKMVAGLS